MPNFSNNLTQVSFTQYTEDSNFTQIKVQGRSSSMSSGIRVSAPGTLMVQHFSPTPRDFVSLRHLSPTQSRAPQGSQARFS